MISRKDVRRELGRDRRQRPGSAGEPEARHVAAEEGTRRVLGVDPGTTVIGWGIVEPSGGSFRRIESGCIRLAARLGIAERLRRIRSDMRELLDVHSPGAVALEKAFVARNVQSAFRLGEARGAILIAAAEAGVPVFEYAPAEVKLKVVGYGRAEKPQMMRGVAFRLGVATFEQADEADALALALCHLIGGRLRSLVRLGGRPA